MRAVSRFNREKLSRLIQVQGPNAIGTVHREEHHLQRMRIMMLTVFYEEVLPTNQLLLLPPAPPMASEQLLKQPRWWLPSSPQTVPLCPDPGQNRQG